MEIEVINCKTKEDIQKLVDDWSITWEGVNTCEESLTQMFAWVSQYTKVLRKRVYVVSGELMNKSYHLKGSNAYKKDLTIVSIMSEDLENKNALTIPRFETGGRWMADIVDNNVRRENER